MIRFSSIGDVAQSLSLPTKLSILNGEIHWVTRHDVAPLLENHPQIHQVWTLRREDGWKGLLRLALRLQRENFSAIYDAHNNLRSRILCWLLQFPFAPGRLFNRPLILRRSLRRWKRFLLFRFRMNLFRQPFSGQRDLIEPLRAWGIGEELPPAPQLFLSGAERARARAELQDFPRAIALVPSAAYPLKRWPLEYWQELVRALPEERFAVFGGPNDNFLGPLLEMAPDRLRSFVGARSLRDTAALMAECDLVISNDTGPMHFAEQLGKPTIAFMGPAPFGFPSRETTLIKERDLPCRPCSKHGQGPCRNPDLHACLRAITPDEVAADVRRFRQSERWP